MIKCVLVGIVAAALTSCVIAPPKVTGLLGMSQEEFDQITSVARVKLNAIAPGAHIFRVHDGTDSQGPFTFVYYCVGQGPARHLVLRRIHGHWRVTEAPETIDTEFPEETIITDARGTHGSNQSME
jgi:hypothetical protein